MVFVCLFLVSGCVPGQTKHDPQITVATEISRRIIGQTVKGRSIHATFFGQEASNTVLILGAIHGDEPASAVLTRQCISHIQSNRHLYKNVRIILIPVANPDGLSKGTRVNANGIDLNRNFPATNRINNQRNGQSPLSEPESVALYKLIETEQPSLIISIHQPYGCVDYDGPAEPYARRMALLSGLPLRKIGAQPGSLGSWAGETLGIPIITFEMTQEDSQLSAEMLWKRYGPSLKSTILTGTSHLPISGK